VKRNPKARVSPRRMVQGVALAALCSSSAHAFEIPAGSSDLNIRWDNTVKYNVGWRMEGRDRALADTWGLQGGEYRFDKGDMVTNRIDLLSEFDFIYKQFYGFRLSGAAWYDAAYDRHVDGNPAYQAAGLATAYPGNRLTDRVAEPYTSSGELLDAFVFGRIPLGPVPLDIKAGRHTVYWGESLFSPIHGVSYSQNPVDFRKAVATPGTEAKELFLPLNQISASAQLTDKISVSGQYFLAWEPYRIYEGSTYFTFSDVLFQRGTNFLGIPFVGNIHSGPHKKPDDEGSWGVNAKVATGIGTLGLYYREFDDKIPAVLSPGGTFSSLYTAYAKDVKLTGVSLSTLVGGTAIGAEVVRRENTALNTAFGAADLARGDTWHALVNAIAYFGKTPLFDSATLLGEVSYSRLDKLYSDTAAFYNGVGHNCSGVSGPGGKEDGCSTREAWGISLTFTPTWFSALPQTDVTMPIHFDTGLDGNSPVPFGGNEDSGTWSVGLGFDYQARYKFDIAYSDYFGEYNKSANPFFGVVPGIGPTQMGTVNGGNAIIHDRGWLSVTFKTTF